MTNPTKTINEYRGDNPMTDILAECWQFADNMVIGEPIDPAVSKEDLISDLLMSLDNLYERSKLRRTKLTYEIIKSLRWDVVDHNKTFLRRQEIQETLDPVEDFTMDFDNLGKCEDLRHFVESVAPEPIAYLLTNRIPDEAVAQDYDPTIDEYEVVAEKYGLKVSNLKRKERSFLQKEFGRTGRTMKQEIERRVLMDG